MIMAVVSKICAVGVFNLMWGQLNSHSKEIKIPEGLTSVQAETERKKYNSDDSWRDCNRLSINPNYEKVETKSKQKSGVSWK